MRSERTFTIDSRVNVHVMAKIGFVDVTATVSYGGVQTAVWQLANALSERGHQVSVIGGEGTRCISANPQIAVQTYPFRARHRLPNFGTRFRKLGERLSFLRQAHSATFAQQFDWLILTKPYDFFWAWLAPRGSRTRFAFMSGGTDFFLIDRFLARRVDAWLACSHFNAWQIAARYGYFASVMFNGVDVKQFAAKPEASAIRMAWNLDADAVVCAYAGRLVGWKGLEYVLRALAHPLLRDRKIFFAVAGDGPEENSLRHLAEILHIENKMRWLGVLPHDQLPAFYNAADIGIFPSISDEAFGITIGEAMSCGKPVIASHVGGIPEVVGNEGSCGRLVPPTDVFALAASVAELACNAALRIKMGSAARRRIENHFTWDMSAGRLERALGTAAA